MPYENLKNFMGESYKDELTLEEVDAFLTGKKFADLSTGKYVDKQKYNDLSLKINENNDKLLDYEKIKPEYEKFLLDKKNNELKALAKSAHIDDQFVEFAISKVGNQENMKEAFEKFAKDYPQFKEKKTIIRDSTPNLEQENKGDESLNELMNDAIRKATGRTTQ